MTLLTSSETLNHVVQQCHRTHGARILRHNAVVNYLARALNNKWTVFEEPNFRTSTGVLKPDLLAVQGESAIVVDASIPSEQADLSKAHQDKVVKYKVLESVIKQQHKVKNVTFTAAIISSRGIWCSRSVNELVDLKVIRKREIKILSTRVLIGGLTAFNAFNKMTSTLTARTDKRIDRIGIG
ncbi:hypothetical protein HCN44_004756 [Aphidius gifuensis]|uniref:Uncharacterized protein n=1 Tax=Aphidius gifuensis TaxID=684658 RepID=A0A834XM89_APHGI|nr:hypothetical protein HCN44_004756 [Aphidius gifuensis]